MLLLVAIFLFSSFVSSSLRESTYVKCCEKNFEVQESHTGLQCINKTSTRYEILSKENNFLATKREGECIDTNRGDFFIYKVSDGKLMTKIETLNYFSKCCPLSYVYNSDTHSCLKKENHTEKFITGNLVKIGLPMCKIIFDREFKDLNDLDAVAALEGMEKGSFCVDKMVQGGFVARECQKNLNICKQKRCFKKCCPDGQSYVGGGTCRDTYVHGIQIKSQIYSPYIEHSEDDYELIYGAGCAHVSLLLRNTIQYSITKNGIFKYYYNYTEKFVEEDIYDAQSYCLEHASKGNISGYHLFRCYSRKVHAKFSFTFWAKILSCVFLLVTMTVYIYLGETKSTFGKILINYCISMTLLMLSLTIAHVYLTTYRLECKIRAYLIILFHLSAFAWVNIMSLDIWWTFSKPKRTIGSDQRRKDLKKFLLYFLYGWGVPSCHVILIAVLENNSFLPKAIQPFVGIYYCFLENRNYARTVFFLIPQLIFQVINTFLFIKTIIYCIRVKNEINQMNDLSKTKVRGKFTADKERLGLIVKLAIIMGVIWIFEVATAFYSNMKTYSNFTKILEIILDNITCLQGIFIFIIFICKKKTFNRLKFKMGFGEQRMSSASMSETLTTHTNGHFPMNRRQTTTMSIT